jgi:hypothetical protein
MRPERLPRACGLALLVPVLLAGCSLTAGGGPAPATAEPVVDRVQTQALILSAHLDAAQRLMGAGPAEQAEIVASARRSFEEAPTASHQLRYALVLGVPNHAASDPATAQRLLTQLLATPETLVPAERGLAQLELAHVERQLALATENQRLATGARRTERERTAAADRRLQAEVEENARLRKALADAEAKLDAIANIETQGRTP